MDRDAEVSGEERPEVRRRPATASTSALMGLMTNRTVLLPFTVYLILTTPLALMGEAQEGSTRLSQIFIHLAFTLVLSWLAYRSTSGKDPGASRDGATTPQEGWWDLVSWLPILLIPFLYRELPVLNQVLVEGYLDPWVKAVEARVFPSDPSMSLAGRWPWAPLSEGLHVAYLSFFLFINIPPLLWWLGGRRDLFRESVFRMTLTFAVCFLLFSLIPVEGPRYGGIPPAGIPDGFIRELTLAIQERGSSRGAAFPSSHVAVVLVQALFIYEQRRGLGVAALITALGLSLGAVYGGFHYGVDVLAGAFVALVLTWMVNRSVKGRSQGPSEMSSRT
jgi:membrane-associated phospholipid phosphatase